LERYRTSLKNVNEKKRNKLAIFGTRGVFLDEGVSIKRRGVFKFIFETTPNMLEKPISLACRLRALFGAIWASAYARYCSAVLISQFFVIYLGMIEKCVSW